MAKFKFTILMIVIAILYSVFLFSLGVAVMPPPEYEDFCSYDTKYPANQLTEEPLPQQSQTEVTSCEAKGGYLEPDYDEQGVFVSYTCETCHVELDEAREEFNLIIFLFMSILGLVSVVVALVTQSKNEVVEWVYNGFLLGGLLSIFVGTVAYFGDAPRLLRPIILFVELAIVIWVAIKKIKVKK